MLNKGQVMQVDEPQTLYDKPAHRDTAIFVGAPQINLLQAEYLADSNKMCIKDADVRLDIPPKPPTAPRTGINRFELGIRPENLILMDVKKAPIQGMLADIEPLGPKSVADKMAVMWRFADMVRPIRQASVSSTCLECKDFMRGCQGGCMALCRQSQGVDSRDSSPNPDVKAYAS
jgi:ABC-type sugar transport system ATPase subunit